MKITVKKSEADKKVANTCKKVIKEAAKSCKTDNDWAEYIKKALDDDLGGPWNVVVGTKFGGRVTHIPGHFLYLEVKKKQILMYSTKNMRGQKKHSKK